MKMYLFSAIGLAAFGGSVWVNPTGAQDENGKTAKAIMVRLNKGPTSLCPTIGKAVRTESPNWEEVQKEAGEFLALANSLTKTDPPRGEKANWDKLTKAYAQNAKTLQEAAEKKDKSATTAAQAKLADMATCATCHKAHRG